MDSTTIQPQMWALITGGVLIILSIVFAYAYNRAKKILDDLWAVDLYQAKELARMVKDGFSAIVEVEGNISCPKPIYAPASQTPCCWVNTTVAREIRRIREVTKTDSKGRQYKTTETYYEWETQYNETQKTIFRVEDETGFTVVDPENAEISSQTLRSEIVQQRESWFDGYVGFSDTGKYKINEIGLEAKGYVFVHGQANEHPEGAIITKPEKGYADAKAKFFFISRQCEEELVKSHNRSKAFSFWFGIASFLAGIGFILHSFDMLGL